MRHKHALQSKPGGANAQAALGFVIGRLADALDGKGNSTSQRRRSLTSRRLRQQLPSMKF